MKSINKGCFVIVLVLLALVAIGLGTFLSFYATPREKAALRRLEAQPELDMVALLEVPFGEQVVVSGKLEGNEEVASLYSCVVYHQEKWVVMYDSENSRYKGNWLRMSGHYPSLNLSIEGGNIKLLPVDHLALYASGDLPSTITERSTDSTAEVAHGIADGTQRQIGLRDNTRVTVVGTKMESNNVEPKTLYMGGRDVYLKAQQNAASSGFTCGLVAMGFGILILGYAFYKSQTLG